MNKIPYEIKVNIILYLTQCEKERKYIIDKSTLDIYNKNFSKCSPIKVFNKKICKSCNANVLNFLNGIKYSL